MSRDAIQTVTSSVDSATDQDFRSVTGTDVTISATPKRAADVRIAHNTGADAVPIQDGGNSITVDATDLDIRDLSNTQDSIAVGDATNIISVQTLDSPFDDTGNGIIITGVRQDAVGSPVSADGDTHPIIFTSTGLLKVDSSINPVPSQNTIEQTKFLLDGTTKNMNVDGSSVNVVYDFSPGAGEVFQIGSMCFYMGQAGGLASDKFENISTLTNGILLEIQADGNLRTFSNLQSNADLGVIFFGGSSTGSKTSWEGQANFATTTRIDGDQSDFVRATIRDDLTSVILIQMAVTAAELI